jgi:cyanate lyase
LTESNTNRTYEAITHNEEAFKAIINEHCGDRIMSVIDFHPDVGAAKREHSETRFDITMNGQLLHRTDDPP